MGVTLSGTIMRNPRIFPRECHPEELRLALPLRHPVHLNSRVTNHMDCLLFQIQGTKAFVYPILYAVCLHLLLRGCGARHPFILDKTLYDMELTMLEGRA